MFYLSFIHFSTAVPTHELSVEIVRVVFVTVLVVMAAMKVAMLF